MKQDENSNVLRDVMNARANAKRLREITEVVNHAEAGVYKRIDENRELIELLQSRCPEFLAQNFWVEGWLCSQDEFLTELAKVTQAENPHASRASEHHYPRPWPGAKANIENKEVLLDK
jgi:thiamine kinase-like enzyme